ncbi:ankyrin repeat and zinc finger domain-containing protein 1 [Solanum pennellii]|uniref:Ankyrin repeat and zinc finger domain-containing protein 1 n=1 Tax=Solanum pennellii TaxID=28526 RepID=A0ABM1H0M4_SOLPN|nr:ankyrin repeat and zinc finger domain-containing protein 1 [Solanum pennellii]
MEVEASTSNAATSTHNRRHQLKQQIDEKKHRSIFELPANFFDSCRLLQSPSASPLSIVEPLGSLSVKTLDDVDIDDESKKEVENTESLSSRNNPKQRWSCNTCKAEFESLHDQRSHFKSDIHRLNIKLSISGRDTIKEEDFDEMTSDSLCKDYDLSSISGSDDEDEKESGHSNDLQRRIVGDIKNKIFLKLHNGEILSLWKGLLLNESESILFENKKALAADDIRNRIYLTENELTKKLKYLIHEPRDNTRLRIVLLARGGHFAGCVFDGTTAVAHKTFHRYVIRAKAGKKQSSKDASGKMAHSAGASIRRYNELALKKEIQDLFLAWKPYFADSSCIFIHAPSNNRQLFFDGDQPYFVCQLNVIRNIPLTVRRPTYKEARRIYGLLTQVSFEVNEEVAPACEEVSLLSTSDLSSKCNESMEVLKESLETKEVPKASSSVMPSPNAIISSDSDSDSDNNTVGTSTPLHEAAKCGDSEKVFELLEQGIDPCLKDERGRTPYMVATEKEVRNAFRRFMASNLDKWDWNAAKVPSALTKEMEETQAAKQAEKNAKKKARAKELKKLRKARQKKAQAEAAQIQTAPSNSERGSVAASALKGKSQSSLSAKLSKEEESKRALDAEREKRAAAAERRLAAAAALKAQGADLVSAPGGSGTDILCCCCNGSLAGKVPFHRYNYKYCSSACMHVHKEILEDG